MTIAASLTADQLGGLTKAAASIARLPAVPTQNWCREAAAAVQHLRPSAFICVTVLTSGGDDLPSGSIVEATGGIAPVVLAHQDDLARIHSDGVGSPGWRIAEALQGERLGAARLRDLSSWSSWSLTSAGKRWKRLGITDLLVGVGCLHPENPNRVLVVELGAGPDYPPFSQADPVVLGSVLSMLTSRAATAYGHTTVTATTVVTPREEEILQLLTEGCTVREIADRLNRSKHTVHDHVKSLHRKLGATSRGSLIARYLGRPSEEEQPALLSDEPTIVTKAPERPPVGIRRA